MIAGAPKETYPGERRVALVPAGIPTLVRAKFEVLVESGAGAAAGYPDQAYAERGARIVPTRAELFAAADVVLQVRALGANPTAGQPDLNLLRPGQILIGFMDPLNAPEAAWRLAATGITAFALELMPRISRAQGMDALSSMATIAGYKAVLLAAQALPRMFPMLMTAAGTITPARVFVVGAGVAGLMAISTARRMGAVVSAFDVRPSVRQEVESVGGKFVEIPLEVEKAEDAGGYARAQEERVYLRQRELMARVVAESDVVICTALVPGRPAPLLISGDMVARMPSGSVIVDLAAEQGGNCESTVPGQTVEAHGATVIGPVNLASSVPHSASQMYARNISTFLLHLVEEGKIHLDPKDPITQETLLTREGEVVNPRIREASARIPGGTAAGRSA